MKNLDRQKEVAVLIANYTSILNENNVYACGLASAGYYKLVSEQSITDLIKSFAEKRIEELKQELNSL